MMITNADICQMSIFVDEWEIHEQRNEGEGNDSFIGAMMFSVWSRSIPQSVMKYFHCLSIISSFCEVDNRNRPSTAVYVS